MSQTQQLLEHSTDVNESQREVREKVLESYNDISLGKGRDCNEFFNKLEKRYTCAQI